MNRAELNALVKLSRKTGEAEWAEPNFRLPKFKLKKFTKKNMQRNTEETHWKKSERVVFGVCGTDVLNHVSIVHKRPRCDAIRESACHQSSKNSLDFVKICELA